VGITVPENSQTVKIIPNPIRANQEFTIIIGENKSHTTIEIYTIIGELICSKTTSHSETQMPGIKQPGTYILRMISPNNQVKTAKILIY
jgi:hypothetical protein